MIASLEDAWKWYSSVKELTLAMSALGRKHWDTLPWTGALGQDQRLRQLEASEILDGVKAVLEDLDDLCVLLLFSVFEATVRKRALEEVHAELPSLRHPALLQAVRTLIEALEHGSFFRVTEAYKALDPDLCEEVNQVRKYRNWVAHGRRGEPQNAVDPRTAYSRLKRFLDQVGAEPTGIP
jgi:hypothetical protein